MNWTVDRPGPPAGVEWDPVADTYRRLGGAAGKGRSYFDTIFPWSHMRLCNLADDGTVNAYYGDPEYVEDGSNGQVMVEVRKCQYRHRIAGGRYSWEIPQVTWPGYKWHPAFVRDRRLIDRIYIGAYEGCAYDVSAGAYHLNDEAGVDFAVDKLSSIAGAKPISGVGKTLNIANARKLAQNRGPGWQQLDFQTVSMLQLLLLVEYASFNSQSVIGVGITNITDDGSTNMGMPTGATASLGNQSGATVGITHYQTGQPANSVSYRGVENLWGNLWQFVDGINIKDNRPWIADHGFESDLFGPPYQDAGVTLPNANGYAADVAVAGNLDHAFLPSALGGSTTTKLCDYYYQNSGNRIALLGGGWSSGSNAGAWCWALNSTASHVTRDIGARLLYVGGD